MDTNSVSGRVTYLVNQSGFTVTDLAKQMGVSRQGITQIMSGGTNPSFAILLKFRQALQVDLNWLVAGDGQAPNPKVLPSKYLEGILSEKEEETELAIREVELKAREEKMQLTMKLQETELKSCRMEVEYLKRLLDQK